MKIPLKPITPDKQYKDNPYSFEVLDIETRNWSEFLVAGFYDGLNYTEYKNLSELVEKINESKYSHNIYCHFGGGFDMLFIIEEMLKQNIDIQNMIPRGSLLLNMKIKGLFKTHYIRDSSAILPFSLDSLTKNFNVETKKGIYDHTKNRSYNPELAEYLKSDCLGLHQVLTKYFSSDLVRRSGPSSTLASQAQKILRCYLKEPMLNPGQEANEFMRKACHGGRTEIFKPLGSKIYEYDVNSLYPYVMQSNTYPDGRCILTSQYKKDKLGIYEVETECPDIHIPIIPFKDDKKLLFPKGKFKTTCTSVEIEYAKTLGYKFKIIGGYYFTNNKPFFKKFITDLYTLRQKSEKNTVNNILAKLIMNSSYGKFIIKPEKTNLILDQEPDARHFRDAHIEGKIYEIYEKPVLLNSYINTGIGSFILAYARIHMHKLMAPISEYVYYTDTDSIFTDRILKSSDRLGELKLEQPKNNDKPYYDKVCFLLPKTYIATAGKYAKIAMKGFDSRKIKHFTHRDFKSALYGEMKLSVDHEGGLARLKSALLKNKIVMNKKAFNKTIKSTYNKRVINLKLNTSEAITLNLK